MGSKRNARYRIVAIDSKGRRDGRPVEQIGIYHPTDGVVKINAQAALKWLHNGAQPTDTVRNLLSHEGIMTQFHNEKTGSNLTINAKTGTSYGADVDTTVGYTAPGTGPKTEEIAEEVIAEVVAEAVEAAEAAPTETPAAE